VQPALQRKRILMVDDDATNREILALHAAKWGMVVIQPGEFLITSAKRLLDFCNNICPTHALQQTTRS
jgi:CheY-like chemotaxis protein